ncbi:GNAT family N-acetyltransferase [Ramlibacter sp. PS4R-6]|uniref:GNAT family N-acetyltransferase n=1 Tax=Ramlibacter sp. PS4R-6 TaxID=3133438 RepID=UPI0030B5DDBC
MNIDVESLERATVSAVAPLAVEECGGWLLAFDGGTVNRARSAVPLSHESVDASVVPAIFSRYRERGVMPNFRIAQKAAMGAVESELARLRLLPLQPTQVLVARAGDVAASADAAGVEIAATPDDAWAQVFLGEGFDPADGASRVATLKRAQGSRFASIREDGRVVAGGVLAMSHGWASVHGMRTALSHRRRGLATRVLAAFAREALGHGYERMALQVEVANDAATRVYTRCGFAHAWTYAYWREQ